MPTFDGPLIRRDRTDLFVSGTHVKDTDSLRLMEYFSYIISQRLKLVRCTPTFSVAATERCKHWR